MEKAYFIMMNSSNRWFPKECQIIFRIGEDTAIEYEDIKENKIKKRTVPTKYVFERYQDAKAFITALYRQGRRC